MKGNDKDSQVPGAQMNRALDGKDVVYNPVASGAEGEDVSCLHLPK